MNRNILYTAVTRVKKMSQIHISAGTPDLHA
jgi:ATP-dependent exoDNAse (exonuclease V) alpha subunit